MKRLKIVPRLVVMGLALLLLVAWRATKRGQRNLAGPVDDPNCDPKDRLGGGRRLPWRFDARRYLDTVTDLELLRRSSEPDDLDSRFPEYNSTDPKVEASFSGRGFPAKAPPYPLKLSLYPFNRCSAWAGWGFINAWRQNAFDLCALERGLNETLIEELRITFEDETERVLYHDRAWKEMPESWFKTESEIKIATTKKAFDGNSAIKCMMRKDLSDEYHQMLCTLAPGTPLMLPRGSYPMTDCYLDHGESWGCNFGWGKPETTGMFPKGSVVVPGCAAGKKARDRMDKVSGAAKKMALSIAKSKEDGETAKRLMQRRTWKLLSGESRTPSLPAVGETTKSHDDFNNLPPAQLTCLYKVMHPVWFIERLDTTNLYHASEDHLSAFLTLLLLPQELQDAIAKSDITIALLDPQQPGPFATFFERLAPNRVRYLHLHPYPPGTCFVGGAIFGLHSATSLFSAGLQSHPWRGYGSLDPREKKAGCRSLLLSAFYRWIRDLYADRTHSQAEKWGCLSGPFPLPERTIPDMTLWSHARDAQRAPRNESGWFLDGHGKIPSRNGKRRIRFRVLWASRRSHESTAKLDDWQKQRALDPAAEDCGLQRMLKLVQHRNSLQCTRVHAAENQTVCTGSDIFWDLETMDPSDVPFLEQVERVSRADVLFGTHGAALAHAIYMRPGSALVEFGVHGNNHFKWIAEGGGHGYFYTPLIKADLRGAIYAVARAMRWIEGREWSVDPKVVMIDC